MDDSSDRGSFRPFKFVLDTKFEQYQVAYEPEEVRFVPSDDVELKYVSFIQF